MGGAVKVLSLLSAAPLPLLYSRRSSTFLRLSAAAFSSYIHLSNPPRRTSCSSIRQLQTQTVTSFNSQPQEAAAAASSWSEWTRLVQWLTDEGYGERARTGSDGLSEDDFVERGDLSEEFLNTGQALILFARENPALLRSLSKKEIGIVVDSVSPFLFKDGECSMKRLRNFLNGGDSYVLQPGKAETIDLVRFLLSYAAKFENNSTNVVSDASVRNLLVELITLSGTTCLPNFTNPSERQTPLQQLEQLSGLPGQTISRKAGDWFCTKCNFMNFARNTMCLECSEPKPKRILTGKEWECTHCNFFNNGRNMSCLRCDCKRRGEAPLPSSSPSNTSSLEDILNKSTIEVSSNALHTIKTGNGYLPIKDPVVSQTVDKILSREPSKTSWESLANQRQEPGHVPFNPLPTDMFAKSKTTKNEVVSDSSDEKFPRMMPVRKGENRFVVSRKKDRSLTTPQYKRRIAMEQANSDNSDFVPFVPLPPDYFAKKRENKLPETGHVSEKTQEISTRGIDVNSLPEVSPSSQQRNRSEYNNRQTTTNNSEFGDSVLFPPNYFAKKKENKISETGQMNEKKEDISTVDISISSFHETHESEQQRNKPEYSNSGHTNLFSKSQKKSNSQSGNSDVTGSSSDQASNVNYYPKTIPLSPIDSSNKMLEGSSIKEPKPLDMSEEAKAERWFKRAAQIKDISELENIPDEDFPEIMPMRKGVNRFVVSKRKTPLERRLTSSEYKRNLPIRSREG